MAKVNQLNDMNSADSGLNAINPVEPDHADLRESQPLLDQNSINPSSAFDQPAYYQEVEDGEQDEEQDVKLMFENTGTGAVTLFLEGQDREMEEVCTVEPAQMSWWDGKQGERLWIVRNAEGQEILRQNLGLYSRNIKVPGSSALRMPGEANRRAKGKQKKIFLNVTNKHDAILEVYSIEVQGNAKKIADIEPDQTKQLFCMSKGHEFVVVNKETLFEVATVYGAEEDQDIVLRPTLGLNFVNTGPETVEVIQLLQDKEEKGLEVYLHPGQNVDYWSLLGDTFLFRSSQSGKLMLQ